MADKKRVIAVDLDGTLAHYDKFKGLEHIGEPIAPMMDRVKQWLDEGHKVVIFTARMNEPGKSEIAKKYVSAWCLKHIGREMHITGIKETDFDEIWDDKAVQIIKNTGIAIQDLIINKNELK